MRARAEAEVARETSQRQARQKEAQSWQDFLERARQGKIDPSGDARYLRETEELALGRRKESRLLSELGRSERPETAHALLLEWGCWDGFKNPYPSRLGISLVQPDPGAARPARRNPPGPDLSAGFCHRRPR